MFSKKLLYSFLAATLPAFAQDSDPGAALPFLERDRMTGEWFGRRPLLESNGVTFQGGFTTDVFGIVTGGDSQATYYAGLMDFGATADLEKILSWRGGSFQTTWLWISGNGPESPLSGLYLPLSGIAGYPTLRLLELWLEQDLSGGKASLRAGQLAADSEFLVSDYGGLFVNSTFGWPQIASDNIPNGGPASPMGTLGARLAASPADWLAMRLAAFQGNVFAQDENLYGFDYSLNAQTGFTFFAEAAVSWGQADGSRVLPGHIKPGVWFQTGANANPLAEETSQGNCGFYAVLDQLLLREDWSGSDDQGLGGFFRISFSPPDRSLWAPYLDAGLTYRGLLPGRDNDTAGIGFAFGQTTPGLRETISETGAEPAPNEMLLEATYQIEVTPWFLLQPDLQFIVHPAARGDLQNALALGLRASFVF
jgi:porin